MANSLHNDEVPTPIFVKTEKAEDRSPPKLAAIPCAIPPQNQAEEMCRWGPHCPICAKSTLNPKAGSSEDRNGKRLDQLQRNYYPKGLSVLPHMTFPTGSLSTINRRRQEGEIGFSK